MICPECHHALSCRINGEGQHCHCKCHDLADDAALLWLKLADMTAESRGHGVRDVTATEATKLLYKHSNPDTDKVFHKLLH